MRAKKFDLSSSWEKLLQEVKNGGDGVIITEHGNYILKEEYLGSLQEIFRRLELIDTSLLLPDDEFCDSCVREREKILNVFKKEVERGNFPRAKQLYFFPYYDSDKCRKCSERSNQELERIKSLFFNVTEDVFFLNHVAVSERREAKGKIIEAYHTGYSTVEIVATPQGYVYSPVFPDPFSPVKGEVFSKMYHNGLGEIQFLIKDKRLTDIYLYPSGAVQVEHREYGLMETTLRLTKEELSRIAKRIRIISGREFDYSNPSLTFFWEEENVRISAIGYSGNYSAIPDIAIRINPPEPYTIVDLLYFKSLDLETAARLTLAANLGASIIFGGDRGGGKTTLMQTLFFMIPRNARKVAILVENDIHTWFYDNDFRISNIRVRPVTETQEVKFFQGVSMERAVKKMFRHGESEYVIFNEIKYEDEARLFLTTAAVSGVSSILTTMHASSPEKIIQRVMVDFKLPLTAIRNLDLIVMSQVVREGVKREGVKRRVVTRITELREFEEDPIKEKSLFSISEYRREFRHESLDKSEFFTRKAEERGLTIKELEEELENIKQLYKSLLESYPVPPLKVSEAVTSYFIKGGAY